MLCNAQTITIKGTINDCNGSDTLIFKAFSNTDNIEKKIKINPGTCDFRFTTQLQSGGYYRLGLTDQNFLMLLLSPGDNISITAQAVDLFGTAKISGSKQTDLFYQANSAFVDFKKQRDSIQQNFNQQQQAQSAKEEKYAINFIKSNPKSLASLMMIDKLNIETNKDVLFYLDSTLYLEYPNNKMVQDFHAEVGRHKFLSEGSIAPDIELKDKNNKKIKLSSLRGKYVLIDFWATWCGPCKAEIPNLKRIYENFHEKGLEIYSISLDRDREKWVKGSDDLTWISVWDENSVASGQYAVSSIPHMLLLDKTGKIIGKNLRGAQLYLKISDLMQQ